MLSPQLIELKQMLFRELEALLEERGVVYHGNDTYPPTMPAQMVADRMGIKKDTVRQVWRKKGLKVVGRNKDGLVFCGASVARAIENQNR
jgi:hypothetical protein